MKTKHHYAWLICLGCALIIFCTSGLTVNAFSIYMPYLIQQKGFSNTQSSAIIAVRGMTSFMSMFLTGIYYRKLSLRAGLSCSGCFVAAGFLIFGFSDSYSLCCVAAAVMGLGYGLGTMIPVSMLIERWFIQKRALALGLCSSASGLSTLGIPTLLIRLVESYGLSNTFYIEAGAVSLLTFISFLLLRSDPVEVCLEPYGRQGAENENKIIARSGHISKFDWFIIMPMILLVGATGSVAYSHLSVHITSSGFQVDTAAAAISVSGITLTLSKCLYGVACEKLSAPRCNLIFCVFSVIGLGMLSVMTSGKILLYCGIISYSIGISTATVGLATWAGDWSSPDQYDMTIRRFQIAYAAGGLLFSPLPGIIADHYGGTYRPAYMFFCMCSFIILVSVQLLYFRQRCEGEKRSLLPKIYLTIGSCLDKSDLHSFK